MSVLLCMFAGCACGGPKGPAPAPAEQQAPEGTLPELEHTEVTLFFPAEDGTALLPEKRQIVKTAEPVAMAKQVVAELIAGPQEGGKVRALPEGTVLRQLYLTPDGTAFTDFGPELPAGMGGGSATEMMAVYAIVNALSTNVPGITRVTILVGGQPAETLNGHMDLTRPLTPRQDLVRG
ncbi:MAG TPA: GerMN domain-containing protein [Candidatus Polarisedimenticolaceae bacterium]|nr:GerMN domain-containing protein [Candidatus Polarisedimenticolaceae bacterium]